MVVVAVDTVAVVVAVVATVEVAVSHRENPNLNLLYPLIFQVGVGGIVVAGVDFFPIIFLFITFFSDFNMIFCKALGQSFSLLDCTLSARVLAHERNGEPDLIADEALSTPCSLGGWFLIRSFPPSPPHKAHEQFPEGGRKRETLCFATKSELIVYILLGFLSFLFLSGALLSTLYILPSALEVIFSSCSLHD